MYFSNLSKSSLIAYANYFKLMLKCRNDQNLSLFLEQCKEELDKRR